MKVAAVIPARYASSRFPGKPLARINGRPMIEWVYRQAVAADCFAEVLVATDDDRIAAEVGRFGGRTVMTSPEIGSGSERVWLAIRDKPDIAAVVNVQGDEPLIPSELLREIHARLENGAEPVVSAATQNDDFDDFLSPHIVKVVISRQSRAIYFSRAPVPFLDRSSFSHFYQHIGVYGYRRDALKFFVETDPSPLEKIEKLEQLRFLENGVPIGMNLCRYRAHGVDIPADVVRIESLMRGGK